MAAAIADLDDTLTDCGVWLHVDVVAVGPQRPHIVNLKWRLSMTTTNDTTVHDATASARTSAISAGDLSQVLRMELARLLAAAAGDRRKALPLGLANLVERQALTRAEATDLGGVVDLLFDSAGITDTSTERRVRTYYRKLLLDPASSPTALAIMSVITSFYTHSAMTNRSTETPDAAAAVDAGDVIFGGFGAVVGAGLGFGFGGPIGAGIGAVVGAAVGVCIENS